MRRQQISLTAAQLAAAGTAAVTVASLSDAPNVVRVPTGLTAYKPAGTAYTVPAGCRLTFKDDVGAILFTLEGKDFLDQTTVQKRYVAGATAGRAFSSNGKTFSLETNGVLSGAGPTVHFQLIYDEIPVVSD